MNERYVRVLIGIRLALGQLLAFSLLSGQEAFSGSLLQSVACWMFRKSYHRYELRTVPLEKTRRNENNRKNKIASMQRTYKPTTRTLRRITAQNLSIIDL
jgi:hypothetical protein